MADMSSNDLLFVRNGEPVPTTSQKGHGSQGGREKRYKPPRLPIVIKSAHMVLEQPIHHDSFFCEEGSPWKRYTIISNKGKFGTRLAQDSSALPKIVAVKQHTIAARSLTINLRRTCHANLVNLLTAFIDENVVFLAYEAMDITLGQLRNQVELEEKYISYICREVLHGLQYFHNELQVCQVDISLNNIFLTQAGDVKIANVGSCLLRRNRERRPGDDIRALGFMMMEIMEPDTASAKPNVIVLMRPERWSREIRNFQSVTQKFSLGELLCVSEILKLQVGADSQSIFSWHMGSVGLTEVLEKWSQQ
ncbi:kinase-like domain-containing protein [Aspergillus varians]